MTVRAAAGRGAAARASRVEMTVDVGRVTAPNAGAFGAV